MILQVHHVALLTSDLDATSVSLTEVLGLPPAQPRSVVTEAYALRTAMVPVGGGTHVQIIQPERGAGVQDLADRGEGTLFEVAFQVPDIAGAGRHLRSRGLDPVDFAGRALPGGFATAASGTRYLYLPAGAVMGPRVEFVQPQ